MTALLLRPTLSYVWRIQDLHISSGGYHISFGTLFLNRWRSAPIPIVLKSSRLISMCLDLIQRAGELGCHGSFSSYFELGCIVVGLLVERALMASLDNAWQIGSWFVPHLCQSRFCSGHIWCNLRRSWLFLHNLSICVLTFVDSLGHNLLGHLPTLALVFTVDIFAFFEHLHSGGLLLLLL